MDRQITYAGALPAAKDTLLTGQNVMVALGRLANTVFGTTTLVDRFTCAPTSPASLSVVLGPGDIYQTANLEANPISGLLADSHTIVKQGILLDAATLGITPPSTFGYSQIFLLEVAYADDDSTVAVLNYYNATAPSSPFYGPPVSGAGSGQAQTTVRKGKASYQIKAGVAAATGSQVAPSVDAGYAPLFLITVANGATTVTSGNISVHPSAPFLDTYLPNIPAAVRAHRWSFAIDTGSVNAYLAAPTVPLTSYTNGVAIELAVTHTNTGPSTINVSGLGTVAVTKTGSAVLAGGEMPAGCVVPLMYYNGTFQIVGAPNSGTVNVTSGGISNIYAWYETPGSYTFTAPAAKTYRFHVWSAGGGGGYGQGSGVPSSGGSSGSYATKDIALTLNQTVACVVGAGGAGATNGSAPGGTGGSSTIQPNGGTLCTCPGGPGGLSSTVSTGINAPSFASSPTNFDHFSIGGKGHLGGVWTTGPYAGNGGDAARGGGAGGEGGSGSGTNGQIPGGGGAGCSNTQTSGSGAGGWIIIEG